ncbi:MAG: VOC family protein [Terrimicrobiaceae bacterium]|nr:VOC family protein [Terrimicrobiaceae bacterium]
MLAVADIRETLQFYSEVLGFSISMDFPEYAIIERDGCTVHFMPAADQSVLDAVRGHTEFYIQVSDIHSLWKHVQTFADRYKMRGLLERDYGMTEFHISDPNECLIFVGEPTSSITKTEQDAAANP